MSEIVGLLDLVAHGSPEERLAAVAAYERALAAANAGEKVALEIARLVYGTATLRAYSAMHGRLLASSQAFVADSAAWFGGSAPPAERRDA